jgi:hypothetical protein
MLDHQSRHFLPSEFDIRNPDFGRRYVAWALEMQGELKDTIARTKKDIAISLALIAVADRILARR